MATVTIGCKLPHGIILDHPKDPSNKVEINGINKAKIIGADHATTEVDADFWAAWSAKNKEFPAITSGAIFAANSTDDAEAMAKEFADRKTGLEPLSQDGKDKRASGVKTASAE